MKVGIFTLPFHSNYGGILQAWALQEVLRKAGHDPVIFRQRGFQAAWALQPIAIVRRAFLRFRGMPLPLLARFHEARLEKNISRFCRERLHQSPLLGDNARWTSFIRRTGIKAVIAGSDQIWRPGATNTSFFLDFLDDLPEVQRIAYAASFGCDNPDFGNQSVRYASLLQKFDALSVREEDAVSFCEHMAGIPVEHVADPTLLLSSEDYEKIAIRKCNGSPVCYFLAGKNRHETLLEETANRLGATFDVLPTAFDEINSLIPRPMPSVENWIGTIASATCVLTDSFHGTVFSILFRKPFVSLDNGTGPGRIRSLLNLFNMKERFLSDNPPVEIVNDLLNKPLPNGEIQRQQETLVNESLRFLSTSLH